MLAAIIVKQKEPLELVNLQITDPLSYGQVLVRVHYSGICGSQLGEIEGVKGEDPYLPHCLGHEGAGLVEEISPGVKNVKVGDHVVLHWRPGQGIQAEAPRYQWGNKTVHAGWVTSFNEQAIVSENRLTVIPKDLNLEEAALLGCAVTTGLGVISNNAKVRIGESILVIGAGGVGLNVIQGARMASAYPIIAVDRCHHKLSLAKELGATHLIHTGEQNLSEEVQRLLQGVGADIVVENTGKIELMEQAYELCSNKGRTIFVGVPPQKEKPSFRSLPLHFGKSISGSHGGETEPTTEIPRYVRLMQSGKLHLSPLITDRIPLHDVNIALDKMRQSQIRGRCVLKISED